MDNKYYTPELSEFFEGFIFESLNTANKWVSEYCNQIPMNFPNWNKSFRVKYLSQEDIEELGFEKMNSVSNNQYLNGNWALIDFGNNVYEIYKYMQYESTVFKGTIKNKSVLKQILKLTNIIK